ncbi:hypothetical protein V3H24_20310 [Vibrio parahaemolyticus]|uniref:hypothetical protein n=1 Tax=Vibrio TaxID=662 RepID=UPI001CDB9CBF|nr:hypothetical protein [Vibrio vulnificus]MCA3903111.1 hypothetical protein [Vibrio vulnificus]
MLKPIKKMQQDSKSNHCELTHLQLLREVGSLDEQRREHLKDQGFQQAAEKRINAIRERMKLHEQDRLMAQEEALLEQSKRERKRRELLEQLGGLDE